MPPALRPRPGSSVPDLRFPLFYTMDPALLQRVQSLDAGLLAAFPEFGNGVAASRVVLRPDEATGRGAYLADGVTLSQRTPVGFYFGEVTAADPVDEFSLAMPVVRRGRTTLHLTVDAGASCRGSNAHPLNMAMYAHSCREPTVHPSWFVELDLPCAVAYAPAGLPAGSPLRWNYDGNGPGSGPGYTLSRREMLDFLASGGRAVPCACRQSRPCPRSRWLRVFDC